MRVPSERWRDPGLVHHPLGFIEPCLPTLARAVPTGAPWVYEIEHDGFRFICRRDGDRVRVFSRRGIDHTDRAPAIADALLALNVRSVTLDGEGLICGPDGVTDFDRLRAAKEIRANTASAVAQNPENEHTLPKCTRRNPSRLVWQ
jgi:bifunctional non-homologous end joining protein LigD